MVKEDYLKIGKKPVMNYLTALEILFKNSKKLVIIAGGRNVSKAVELVCLAMKKQKLSFTVEKTDFDLSKREEKLVPIVKIYLKSN